MNLPTRYNTLGTAQLTPIDAKPLGIRNWVDPRNLRCPVLILQTFRETRLSVAIAKKCARFSLETLRSVGRFAPRQQDARPVLLPDLGVGQSGGGRKSPPFGHAPTAANREQAIGAKGGRRVCELQKG